MIKPEPLKRGDKVIILSPAGAVREPHIVEQAARQLTSWGLDAVIAPHTLTHNGYYSATPEERAQDFISALEDKSVKAILCSYGGYGCVHLLQYIKDYISKNPKWIIGMSDCCVLHAAAVTQGVMSLHAPQCRHLAERGYDASSEYLRQMLFGWTPHYSITPHELNRNGAATGMVVGGNLSVLTSLIGTPYDIIKPSRILFIEDVNEPPYKIERMLYMLKLSGALASLAALVVGEFAGCKENPAFGGTIYEIIRSMVEEYGYPLCFGFPTGHTDDCYPMIEGANATLDVGENGVEFSFNQL